MTIDESNRILVDRYIDTYVVCGGENYNPAINITRQDCQAFQVAIHTMRKYQKIEQILKDTPYCGDCDDAVRRIQEVIEDDNSTVDNSSM